MIKINLLKEEKKGRGISLPSVKGFSKEDLIQEGAIKVLLVIFAIALVAEFGYIFTLKRESSSLEAEKNRLVQDRNLWRAKAQRFLNERRDIEAKINRVKARIEYLEKSKDVILTMRKYYVPFASSLEYVYRNMPPSIWFPVFVQYQNFEYVYVFARFASYDINTMDEFFRIVNKEYPIHVLNPPMEAKIREFDYTLGKSEDKTVHIVKELHSKLNNQGIIYYTSFVRKAKPITLEDLGE